MDYVNIRGSSVRSFVPQAMKCSNTGEPGSVLLSFFFFFFFIFSSRIRMLWILKFRPEQQKRQISQQHSKSVHLFTMISFYNFPFSFFPLFLLHFPNWSFKNCCLYTNLVLVLNLTQLFLYKTVIIYVWLNWESASLGVSVNVCVCFVNGFLTTSHLSVGEKKKKRQMSWVL